LLSRYDTLTLVTGAFCFYNVSSILNGLIYFDQFRLIPSLYLGLVSLGTAILLAGVWIVSVQPNGEGIAVDGWETESASVSDVGVITEEPIEPAQATEDVVSSRLSEHPPDDWPQVPADSEVEPFPPLYDSQRRPSMNVNTSIPHHKRFSTGPLSPTGMGLGGLQIGLSAVSPGFAIRPEHRGTRRRLSSLQAEEGAQASIRRTTSEGNPPLDGDIEAQHNSSPPEPSKPKNRRRWRWFKRKGPDV
jgi:hypothetical protein